MTREEQINQTAISEQRGLMESYDWRCGFISGAKWSDEHPKEGLVSIDKVCEYLKSLVYQEFGGGPLERTFSDEDIEDFRKVMEG